MKAIQRKQSGFTLVEIAIVMVIIGLLLGGVLKGQEMIENARIKAVVNDMNGVSAAYNSYFDRYRALPGDEANATMVARGWTTVTANGNGNGVLTLPVAGTFVNTTVAGSEQPGFWQALRAAQFLPGDPAGVGAAALPRTGTGGLIGVTTGAYGIAGMNVCVSGLTTKQVLGIDVVVDGALPANGIGNNIGTLRSNTSATNPSNPVAAIPAGTAYNETAVVTPWTACRTM